MKKVFEEIRQPKIIEELDKKERIKSLGSLKTSEGIKEEKKKDILSELKKILGEK